MKISDTKIGLPPEFKEKCLNAGSTNKFCEIFISILPKSSYLYISPLFGVIIEIANKRKVNIKKFGNLKFKFLMIFENIIIVETKIQIPEILHG